MNRTVQRSVELMRLIADSRGGMANELAASTPIPKTTRCDMVITLHGLGINHTYP